MEPTDAQWDDGWRFNAVQHLDEMGLFSPTLRAELAVKDQDRELLDLLIRRGDWSV